MRRVKLGDRFGPDRTAGGGRMARLVFCGMILLSVPLAGAQPAGSPASAAADSLPAVTRLVPTALPAVSAADTVRTNLWLTEALMAEIVAVGAAQLPPPPAAVRLRSLQSGPRNDLFRAVAARVLGEQGYDLYLPEADSTRAAAVDYVLGYSVQNIKVAYPDVGRTLGVWRRWVARDLEVSALIEVSEAGTGRLLLSQRVVRRFGDRVADDAFDLVNSDVYDFTSAETSESGWKNRLEEIVVLGTLAGLVSIYFANTGN